MNRRLITNFFVIPVLLFSFSFLPQQSAYAADDNAAMKARIDALEKELAEMKSMLKAQIEKSATKEEVQAVKEDVKEEVKAAKKEAKVAKNEAREWKVYDSAWHLAGYAAAGWKMDNTDEEDRFNLVQFSPVFHYQYKDLIMFEGELEFEVENDGGVGIELEYAAIDWFMHDYVTLQAGKFLSPIGQFRQNTHPTWINKLPTAPPGFGHDQAAPLNEIGVQFRGGFPIPLTKYSAINYAIYVGNGPELEREGDEIEGIESEGFPRDLDDEKVYGGRLGFLPFPNLEIGISGETGDVALEIGGIDEPTRDYHVYDVDLNASWKKFKFLAEYVHKEVEDQANSIAPAGQRWAAWYTQLSYLFPYNFEGVIRYADYDSTHASQEQEQFAIGLNYLISPNAIAKLSYEWNDALNDDPKDEDAFYLQLTYGF